MKGAVNDGLNKYKSTICFAVAVLLLIVCNYAVVSRLHTDISNISEITDNSGLATPSDRTVSPSQLTTLQKSEGTATQETTKSTVTETTASPESTTEIVFSTMSDSPYRIVVYLKNQSVVVYSANKDGSVGEAVKQFVCSSGDPDSPTPAGEYATIGKYRWRALQGNVWGQYCTRIVGHYLFHSVPYYQKKAFTLENEEYDKLGEACSMGCIRMCVRDCKWIYDNAPIGTPVMIIDANGPAGIKPPARNTDPVFNGWDPTDEWAKGNPYFDPKYTTAADAATSATSVHD